MITNKTAEKILEILIGRNFEVFYDKELMDYITGEENAPTEEEILEIIKIMFREL